MTTTYGPANIDPAEWALQGNFYTGHNEDMQLVYAGEHSALARNLGTEQIFDAMTFHANGGCASCGTAFSHGGAFKNADGTVLAIGWICSCDLFNLTGLEAKKVAKLKGEAARIAKVARVRIEAEAFIVAHELADVLEVDHFITEDIRFSLFRYGSISPAQIHLLHNIAKQEVERKEMLEERAAEEAKAFPIPVTDARVTVRGEILSTKVQETMYGTTLKMLVRSIDGGWKVWGSVPSSLDDLVRGDLVQFDAAITVSDDDPKFGFFKRPTKATRL